MPDESDKPATKTDITLLRADLTLLGADLRAELAAKIEPLATKAELRKDIARVATEIVNLQADVREIRHDMATKLATKDDINRVLNAIDAFVKKSENNDKSVVLHGHVLTEVQVSLKDHEGRLKALESARR